ncbi:hypothetical protein GCM10027592_32710 [Spirosoma flavus]
MTHQSISDSNWRLTADSIDPNNYFGVTVANGMVGLVSSVQPMQVQDVILNGVYDNYQRGRVENILKVFNHLNCWLDVDGKRVSAQSVSHYVQTLDMKTATLVTTFEVANKLRVRHSILSLRHLPFTAMIEIEFEALADVVVTPASVIEAPAHLQDIRSFYSQIDRPHVTLPLLTSVAKSPSGKYVVAASNSFIFEEPHGQEPMLIHEDWDHNLHLAKFSKTLQKGGKYSFAVVGSVISSAHVADAHNEAERLTVFAKLEGRDRLLKRHHQEWIRLWQSDIEIDGDEHVQRAVRSAIYHLYSFVRADFGYSLSPMGLSGLGYNGHVFWDTELWMYPALLMLRPELAKSLLDYRFERMEAARQNARSHGFRGVMFPWESAGDGSEQTPVWALTGPFQHHITGCIGWAFWKYYQVTKDKKWLAERGFPLLREVAEFWCSRVERNQPDQYDINNVIGANEWEENIDNNAFTNGMAKTVLHYAVQAAHELGFTPDPDWQYVADRIPILTFPDGTTRENATYIGVDIKQADVNLLAYPLNVVIDEAAIRRDLDYYTPRLSPEGPAMGPSVLAVLYARIGETEKAYEWLLKSYRANEVPPFGVLAECAGGTNPYFATGAGGLLQAVLAGFGGLDITDEGLVRRDVALPQSWKGLRLKGFGV